MTITNTILRRTYTAPSGQHTEAIENMKIKTILIYSYRFFKKIITFHFTIYYINVSTRLLLYIICKLRVRKYSTFRNCSPIIGLNLYSLGQYNTTEYYISRKKISYFRIFLQQCLRYPSIQILHSVGKPECFLYY